MRHTKHSVLLNKLNFIVRTIVSDLKNDRQKQAVDNSCANGITPEQFGYLIRVHNIITDKELSAFIHYIVSYQLTA